MAIALVQTQTGTSSSTTLGLTWSGNTTTGNLIVISIVTTSTLSSIVDSQSNTYSVVGSTLTANTDNNYTYYAKNITGGTTPTVTITIASTAEIDAIVREYSGLDTSSPLDQVAGASAGFSTSPSSGATSTTTQADELVIGWSAAASNNPTYVLGSGYGNLSTQNGTGGGIAMEDKIVAATGAQTATFTSAFVFWTCGVASFKGASAAPAGPKTLNNYQFIKVGNGMSVSEKIK
jgi:hypothetical protein